jgi:hypothetical protein
MMTNKSIGAAFTKSFRANKQGGGIAAPTPVGAPGLCIGIFITPPAQHDFAVHSAHSICDDRGRRVGRPIALLQVQFGLGEAEPGRSGKLRQNIGLHAAADLPVRAGVYANGLKVQRLRNPIQRVEIETGFLPETRFLISPRLGVRLAGLSHHLSYLGGMGAGRFLAV